MRILEKGIKILWIRIREKEMKNLSPMCMSTKFENFEYLKIYLRYNWLQNEKKIVAVY